MRTKTLYFTLALSFFLFVANIFALKTNLYWTTSWADIITHVMGGMIVAGVTILLWDFKKTGKKVRLGSVVASVIIVGIAWEAFELYYAMTAITDKGFIPDTIGDILFDTLGAYLGYRFLVNNSNN